MTALMTVGELGRVLSADVRGDGRVAFSSVSTDSRTLAPGALFVALTGERFDGHDYVQRALEKGAVAALVDRAVDANIAQLVVGSSRRAFGIAAAAWRARFALPVIAVAGSNGKTTVTQMIAAILAAAHGDKGRLATRGNLNNDIGVPLMLWELNRQHRAAVFELGMNHPGEIEWLAHLVQPGVAVVNNAQREHQEFMATIEATAYENGATLTALSDDGVAVFPADDACAPIWRQLAGTRRVVDFALDASAVVATATYQDDGASARVGIVTPADVVDVTLAAGGLHTIRNALAAAAGAVAAGIDTASIGAGLSAWQPVAGRGARLRTEDGATLIDDSYNANPDSVRAAIDLLAAAPSPRVLILGDMGEVGARGVDFHREVGAYARECGIDAFFAIGSMMRAAVHAFGADAVHFDDVQSLVTALKPALPPGATALVKGSRFMQMERVVLALTARGLVQQTAGEH